MKEGVLIYNPYLERMGIRFGLVSYRGGLHCGEALGVWSSSEWEPTRIEQSEKGWFLVGISTRNLSGLRVRI